jgi:hypothetical protein
MSQPTQGRLDVLILRLTEELGNRFHAQTTIDIRDSLKEAAEHLIEDAGIPKVAIDANAVLRSLLDLPDRKPRRLRRVV